jgi:hypothetical protein
MEREVLGLHEGLDADNGSAAAGRAALAAPGEAPVHLKRRLFAVREPLKFPVNVPHRLVSLDSRAELARDVKP